LSRAHSFLALPDSLAAAYFWMMRKERIMSRLVRNPVASDLDQQIAGLDSLLQSGIAPMQVAADPGDNYLERAVKYIPAEVIGFSLIINAILDQAMKAGGPDAAMAGVPIMVIATGVLLVSCILTPLFCWYVHQDGDAWMLNAAISTIAFPFWAYLTNAVAFSNFHDGNLAVILVATFTVVSGLVSPVATKAKAAEQQQAAPVERPRLINALDVA
jgi:hypothetical protein